MPTIPRAIFRLSGPDAARYLQGQVTQDVQAITEARPTEACVTNHKGKLDAAPIFIFKEETDSYLIDAPLELRQSLFTRLDRYIIADDCALSDVTDTLSLLHNEGGLPNPRRYGFAQGTDTFVPTEDAPPSEIPQSYEHQRIAAGIPTWGKELDENTLPPEAGLDAHAISYTKGCYIGQEVISRIKTVGKVPRRLWLFSEFTGETATSQSPTHTLAYIKKGLEPQDCGTPIRPA